MYFYTEVVGLEPAKAGLIFMIGMVWDAISDPLIGIAADRTRTRWGRYRPYLLFGALPYGVCIALLFTPPGGSESTVFLTALVAHLLFRTSYTLVYMPYTAMIARLTTDYDARTELTAFKTFFVFSANLTVSFFFYTLVFKLGAGDESKGFLPTASLIGIIAAGTCWLCFLLTEESTVHPTTHAGKEKSPLSRIAGDLLSNKPFLMVFFGVAIFGGFYGAQLAMIPYFAKYWFNDPAVSRTLFTTQAVLSLLSIPVWLWVGRQYGKKTVWISGTSLAAIALVTIFFMQSTSVWLTAFLYGLSNMGATGFILIFYAMTADVVDWGEWQTGQRQEGLTFGAISFANKFAAGVTTGAVGAALSWVGFISDNTQSVDTLFGMRVIGLLVPALAFSLSALLMLGYPLSKDKHEDIVAGRVTI